MSEWKTVLAQGALAGSLASVLSTAVLVIAGRREAGSAAAPINAVSHWYWGDEAPHCQRTDLTHHGAATFWALAGVYAAFAVGLGAGALALRDHYRALDRPHAQPQDEAPPVIRRVRAGQV